MMKTEARDAEVVDSRRAQAEYDRKTKHPRYRKLIDDAILRAKKPALTLVKWGK